MRDGFQTMEALPPSMLNKPIAFELRDGRNVRGHATYDAALGLKCFEERTSRSGHLFVLAVYPVAWAPWSPNMAEVG